jgi:3D (Asp-Asp-Asp) domain-containing protein
MLRLLIRSGLSAALTTLAFCLPPPVQKARLNGAYRATAYHDSGLTASGEWAHRHVVAADPHLLPVGSRIQIRQAGRYSGEYVVADTGAKIHGRRLDIYMPEEQACKQFGTRQVRVRVLSVGNGTQAAAQQADQAVKADVIQDLHRNVKGNAATEEDWRKAPKRALANRKQSVQP